MSLRAASLTSDIQLPPFLETLKVSSIAANVQPLPSSLTSLSFRGGAPDVDWSLLSHLKKLKIKTGQGQYVKLSTSQLPSSLTSLKMTQYYEIVMYHEIVVDTLPPNLQIFKCRGCKPKIDGVELPSSLTKFSGDYFFRYDQKKALQLTSLKTHWKIYPHVYCLPEEQIILAPLLSLTTCMSLQTLSTQRCMSSLTSLHLTGFNDPLDDAIFPQGLRTLCLDSGFQRDVKEGVLPSRLYTLELHTRANVFVPDSVRHLIVCRSCKLLNTPHKNCHVEEIHSFFF